MSSNHRQAAPRGPGWAHELKHDGYRLQIHVRNGRVRLYTMNGANWTDRYPCIIEEAARIKGIVSCGRWRLKFGMVVRGRGHPQIWLACARVNGLDKFLRIFKPSPRLNLCAALSFVL